MPDDTLDEIEAQWRDVPPWMATLRDSIDTWPAMIDKAWAVDLFERHDEAVSHILILIKMVRARDRVPNIDVEGGDLLKQLDDDASKWAAAFCDIAKRKGLEIDEEWMIGWFANAIEHSGDVRRQRAKAATGLGTPPA